MAKAIVDRWNHFENENMTYDDAVLLWKNFLRTHFKRSRGKNKENNPEILAKRITFGKRRQEDGEEQNGQKMQKLSKAWGVPNYLPDRDAGEDEHTQEQYLTKLKSLLEMPAHRRDKGKVQFIMKKTFADRRRMIVTQMAKVSAVLERYPALKSAEEVCIFSSFLSFSFFESLFNHLTKSFNLLLVLFIKNSLHSLMFAVFNGL